MQQLERASDIVATSLAFADHQQTVLTGNGRMRERGHKEDKRSNAAKPAGRVAKDGSVGT